ncbi:MAG: Asp-tRNA(Asn)/Glu-tRNA(Gln) amidotransferase subunit GatB [Fimbriimonadales bacterium]|nr:Asp-tRNA(Asn)/Glu-tRNA(Gln) amidotransferase subunit GatB [Fimbriimonadales bacterium]
MRYVTSVGMEVHAELLTKTKMFCRCPNAFGGEVNTRVCPVCLGLPGSLPVINRQAVEHVVRTALALNCQIAMWSVFHRKNYFYPDLPKGYQISQYGETNPIGYHGWIEIPSEDGENKVSIQRVHLEEDTGKLMHLPGGKAGVDFNRAGVPLMEIVTAFPPDIHTPDEAREYLHYLRLTLIHLGASDGKMEQGSFRCEPNISVAPEGSDKLGTKTELKNLGSFKAVSIGIQHEAERMISTIDNGGELHQETRGWDEGRQISYPMRKKEREHDYRYFPDPDLPPMVFDEEYIEGLRAALPELPLQRRKRYIRQLGLSAYDASLLITDDPGWAEYFDEAVSLGGSPKLICNWMNGDFLAMLNEEGLPARESSVSPAHIVDLVALLESNRINGKQAKEIFEQSFKTGEKPSDIVKREGLEQLTDESEIRKAVKEAMNQNPDAVQKYKEGKTNIQGFLIGQVMKKTQGKANPEIVSRVMTEELER